MQSCEILRRSVDTGYFFENVAHAQTLVVTDEALQENMISLNEDEKISLQSQLTKSRDILDLSQLSAKVGLQWVASLPGRDLNLDGEAFPFRTTLEISKKELTQLLGRKKGIALKWIEPIAFTFDALCSLIAEGKVKHLKLQGGFEISEKQFAQLKKALLKGKDLHSLELSNSFSEKQMIELAEAIPHFKQLQVLTLETNGMSDTVVAPFKAMIEKCHWVSQMKFTFSWFDSLKSLGDLHQSTVKGQTLDLSQNWDFA